MTRPQRYTGLLDLGRHRAVAWCVIVALLTAACSVAGHRPARQHAASPADREACADLARRSAARVQGSSIGLGAALGAGAGALGGVASVARSRDRVDDNGAVIIGAVVGGLVIVGGLIGAGVAEARKSSVRRAAYTEAMEVCLRPTVLVQELGPEHPEIGRSLHALAYRYYRYYRQEEFLKAESLLMRALAIPEKSLGANAAEVATILEDYARLLRRTDRAREVESLDRRAREIRSRQ